MPNPFYTYISNMYDLVWFYCISTLAGSLMPIPVFTYILDIQLVNISSRYTQLNDQIVLFLTIQFSLSQS